MCKMIKKSIADLAFVDVSSIGGIESGTRRRLQFLNAEKRQIFGIYFSPSNSGVLKENGLITKNIKFFFLANIKKSIFFNRLINIPLTIAYVMILKIFYRVNTFHCHDLYSAFACSLVKKITFHTKVFVTWHGPASYELIHFRPKTRIFSSTNDIKPKYKFVKSIYLALEKFVCKNADAMMAISEFEKEYYELLNPKNKIVIIRNSVDTKKFAPGRCQSDDKIRVTFIGRLEQKNGPDLLIQSLPYFEKQLDKIHFVIVGSGFLEQSLKQYTIDNNFQANVTFLGRRYDVDNILKTSDIFVSHCSSLVDGIGNNVIEAVASGVPCIVGSDKINEKIFTTGQNAILVQKDNPQSIANAIILLSNDHTFRKSLSKNARILGLKEFSIESNLKRMLAIIER